MLELQPILMSLSPALGSNIVIIEQIIKSIYCISSGGVTMKNMSRWTGKGGSYRSIQRFFAQPIDWLWLNMLLLKLLIVGTPDEQAYVLAVDEVVEDKAGKHTFGVNWFYSSIAGKVIRSLSHHVISLVNTQKQSSFVLHYEQTEKPAKKPGKKNKSKQKQAKPKTAAVKKKPVGRPKGSKNKQNVKSEGLLYESFELLLSIVVPLIVVFCPYLKYVLADGAYGNKSCCLIVAQFDLELISKLNRNTALFLPYSKPKRSKRGRPRKYGNKIDYQNIPKQYLVKDYIEDGIATYIYQIQGVWTKKMPALINVVIIVKIDLATQKTSRVVLFSTDLTLDASVLIKFYALRFQIEFNFRDAKQYFGLSDFKNIKQQQVKNAVGLAFFMTNISMILIEQAQKQWEEEKVSIQDLKACFRGQKYLHFILNTLQIDPKPVLNQTEIQEVLKIGAVNRTKEEKMAA